MEVNNTVPANSEGHGAGFFLGITLLIIFAFFVFYYGIPAIRNAGTITPTVPTTQPVNEAPSGGTNIQVPDKIDVNIDK